MGKKLMIFAGVLTLLQAAVQAVFSSLSLAQYFNLIDFLRELPNLLYIKILYFHNPIRYGPRINIGQVIDGIADQAFVLQINEPFTVTRTFSINCVSLALSVLWIIASSILLAGGARNEYSRPIRWPWIAVTVSICAVDLVATVTFANDSFHTRTLNNIMDYIGGTVSGIGSAQLNTSAAAWIMVSMYSRFVIFFVLNVTVIVLIALNKNISSKADAVTVESPVMTPPIIPPAPIMLAPPPAVEIISPMAQLIDVTVDDDEERTRAPEVNVPAAIHTSTKVKTTSEPRTIIPLPPPVPLSNITEASSNVSSTRDIDEVTLREEEITSMSNVLKNDKETVSSPKIPRAGFSQAFRNMKKFLFTKESPRRDSVVESVEVSPERSPELDRFLVRLISNVNRVTGQDSASSVRNTHLNRQQGRPSLPIGWLVLSAILSRSPRIQHANDDKKRAVNFPDNLLSLPQRLENLIAEQQRRLDRAIINTSGRTSPPRTSQSLPHLNGNSEETNPAFNKGRRGTAAELQGQLPWAYIPASAHRMRDQLPPDEDLPPVPLPDYTAIPSFRKASVHRAASSLSSLTHKKLYTNQLPRNKCAWVFSSDSDSDTHFKDGASSSNLKSTDGKMKENKPKVPHKLMMSALLSAGLALVLSLATIVLCLLALVYRYYCPVAEPATNGAEYFIITLIKVYILKTECKYSLQTHNLTKSDSIFIFVIILTIFCLIHVFSAIGMLKVVTQEVPPKCMDISIYIYIGASLAVLVVDLTLSVHFGLDYAKLKHELSLNSAALAMNYEMDVIRLGSLLLMSVALKGYVGHAANIVLLVLLVIYVNQYRRSLHQVQHSIHKLGPLDSFEVPRALLKTDESWSPRNTYFSYANSFSEPSNQRVNIDNGPQHVTTRDLNDISNTRTNPEFNEGEPTRQRAPVNENPISNRNYDRSTSWLHDSGARPFSYLEMPKQPAPVKPAPIPANDPHWRRDLWHQAPMVPDPDYSPQPRRLKSVLKSNFM